MSEEDKKQCSGCYQNHVNGEWWCDNCEQWPCICIPDEEEDEAASNVVGRHDTEPVNDFEGTGFNVPTEVDPAAVRFAADIIEDAVRKAQVEQIRKEDLGITVDGGFVPSGPRFEPPDPIIGNNTGEPLGFLNFNPSDVVPVVRHDRTIPVGGLPELTSQLDYDRSVEALRREFRNFLSDTIVGYGSISAKNRAADFMTDALIRKIEPKYHAVWRSADYFKSAMESWKQAAQTEVTVSTELIDGFLGSVTPDDGLDRPPLSQKVKIAGDDFVYLSLPKHEIPSKVTEYVAAIETQRTNEWCKCQWIVHPDDVDLPAHGERKRRMRRGDTHPQCAVHTKEGFILGFFEWYFRDVPETSEEDSAPAEPKTRANISFTLNNGEEIPVHAMSDGTLRCASYVSGDLCGTPISPLGDRDCPNVDQHDAHGMPAF